MSAEAMLPKISVEKLRKAFVNRVAARQVRTFMEGLGPERVEWMVANRRPLESLMDDRTRLIAAKAPHYAWVEDLITDEEFEAMFPEWSLKLLDRHGEEARAWFLAQMAWMRSLFRS